MKAFILLMAMTCSLGAIAKENKLDPLEKLRLPDVRIISVALVDKEVDHFDVKGVIGGTINFELLLPVKWNKRFVMGGGGGFVGSVQNGSRAAVKEGYATVGTDTGHQGTDGSFALDDAYAQVNFGHVAIHRTTEVAKAIIRIHYGSDPEYSYFLGCSRGGGQAMMEAQRYPDDFDGIVAGAPAFDWKGLAANGLQIVQAFYPNPKVLGETVISPAEIKKLAADIYAQCDEQDGLKDGIISDPATVKLDLDKIEWLNAEQRAAVQVIYDGISDEDGEIHPGYPVGSEIEWFAWLIGPMPNRLGKPSLGFHFSVDLFKYFVFNDTDWDYSTYDFSTLEKDWELTASTLSATDTNLDDFKALDGKLILWHGMADAALSATRSAQYYDALLERDPKAMDYSRLYLIPGCGHCGGGPGISSVNWLEIISDWVEKGDAPDLVNATRGRKISRPLSPYPSKTVYKGSGDANSSGSFESVQP